jgi:3-oxoadipate enol-lactonase
LEISRVDYAKIAFVKYHVKRRGLKSLRFSLSIIRERLLACEDFCEGIGMDRLFVDGSVNAAEQGAGPPLFLFHSLLSDRASFDAVAPELAASFRVIVPELPGFGRSRAVAGGLDAVADRMADLVREAAPVGEAIVLGNGYGGFVALQMAIRHPNLAARLLLADSGAAFSEPGRQAFRNMAAAAREKGLAAITDVAMRRLFAPEFQAAHPVLMQDRREAFLRTDESVFRAACEALASLDLRAEVSRVKVPVLVMVGEHDEATPPPMSHELASLLPDARLKIIPGCAHVPQLQSPKLFLEAIADFLPAAIAR